jgi:hypothetical protein
MTITLDSYLPGLEHTPPRSVVIPKPFHGDALEIAKEDPLPHPVWGKLKYRQDRLMVITNEVSDLEELADFAQNELTEPRRQLTKTRRDAARALLLRCGNLAVLETIAGHVYARRWKEAKEA